VQYCTAHVGSEGEAKSVVTTGSLASTVKSGAVDVYSTAFMAALMEEAACNAVADKLATDPAIVYTSVGVALNIKHISASPPGANVRAKAVITEIKGKLIKFNVEAFDDKEKIGEGTHDRVIVNKARFLDNAFKKVTL